jgi:bzd-type benzoyl-CoA reductase Q subunit
MMDTAREYWRWEEYSWRDPEIDPGAAQVISAGVDVGSVSSQAVIMADRKLFAVASMRTGSSSPESARNAMDKAMEQASLGLDDMDFTVGTGYGRLNISFAQKAITEIACHARGANFIYGSSVRTVLDMGGQDCKAIRCDERGKVQAFLVNDKCAAGTGRGMEVMADLFAVPIEELGGISLEVEEEPPPIANTCVVYAKSEATGLIRRGWSRSSVLAAYCAAMARRVAELLGRVGVERDFAVTGGIAKNPGVVRRVERELGVESLKTGTDTQLAGAIGAALFAHERFLRKQERTQG